MDLETRMKLIMRPPTEEVITPEELRMLLEVNEHPVAYLDLLADPRTDFRVKLADYARVKDDVFEFCRFYARWLGNPLMERLRAEIYELLDQAVSWWGEQDILDIMGC